LADQLFRDAFDLEELLLLQIFGAEELRLIVR
jgi:hypothetical protein